MSLAGNDMVVKLELLRKITNNFSEEQKVGSGGYGDVYRAIYNGQEIAVKKFYQHKERLDDKEFKNEVLNLREIQHQNIVRLLGYCYEIQHMCVDHNGRTVLAEHIERLLCFEYMQGGSLEKHISDESCDLDWPASFQIIRGICEGLNHLHTAKGKPIYHLDLKPANILLDKNNTAKIGDLGLSKLAASSKTQSTGDSKGTMGYMPPEYINGGGVVSNKFDVFSLGVIIIKMLAGNTGYHRHHEMPSERFVEFVTEKWKEKLQQTKVYLSQETDILQLKTCVDIALRCVKDERNERPDIKGIVHELEKLEPKINKISTNPAYYRSGGSHDIRQTEHRFHLYMTQRAVGTDDSNETFVAGSGFGSIYVDDFYIRDGPAPTANLVGRARGMHVCNGIRDDHWLFCHSILFTDTRFKGSSIKMLGDLGYENDAEWAIVGGSGEFAYAHGAVRVKVIQTYTPATGRIFELRIRAFCFCIPGKTKMGPWDWEAGAAFDIPEAEPPRRLETVTVGYGDVINSIAFSYTNEAGQKKTAGPWGSHGADNETIMLAPSEIIKQVLGTTSTIGGDTVVTSLTLVSNLTTYGPFGATNGTPFCSQVQDCNKSITGFYARAGEEVNALGVYYTSEKAGTTHARVV